MPPQQLKRAADPDVALRILRQGRCCRQPRLVVAAKATGTLTRDLAKATRLGRASPGDPDSPLPILDDAVGAILHALTQFVVLPTHQAASGSDPESAV